MKIFLNNSLYRLFITSATFGYAGRTLFDIAFIIYATNLPNPELAMSIVSIATTFPYIISFILGYFSDKTSEKYDALLTTRFYQFLLFILLSLVCVFGVTWWVFAVLVVVNVISDILGGYNGYLSMSITTRLVEKNELSSALAFRSSIYNIISLGGKAVGVLILGLVSYNYSYFGLLNSALFFIAFFILKSNRGNFKNKIGSYEIVKKNTDVISINRFCRDTFHNIKKLKKIKKIYSFVLLFSCVNLYSAGMHALFLVIIVKSENLVFGNVAYTVTLLELVEIISMVLGGIYQLEIYKDMTLKNNVIIEMLIFIIYILNIIYLQNKYILLILIIIIGYLAGISNPKLDALILQSVPEENQTSIFSIFSTLITLTVPIGTVIILFISNVFSVNVALYVLLILLLILTIYSLKLKEK